MKEVDRLESYIESPLSSTLLVIAYKGKTYDKRTKFYKALGKYAEIFQSNKLKDEHVPDWINDQLSSRGLRMQPKALTLLYEHIGNDLARINSELEKLTLNLGDKKEIDDADIEKYVGISKEYNVFELQGALAAKDLPRAMKILNYFEANPKAAPIQAALPALYSFIGKIYSVYGMPNTADATLKPVFYFNPVALSQAKAMLKNYGFHDIEKMILLMHEFNLRSLGVGDTGSSGASLMKEMVAKMMMTKV
jgi:DNA polymerase-3 subunit delta